MAGSRLSQPCIFRPSIVRQVGIHSWNNRELRIHNWALARRNYGTYAQYSVRGGPYVRDVLREVHLQISTRFKCQLIFLGRTGTDSILPRFQFRQAKQDAKWLRTVFPSRNNMCSGSTFRIASSTLLYQSRRRTCSSSAGSFNGLYPATHAFPLYRAAIASQSRMARSWNSLCSQKSATWMPESQCQSAFCINDSLEQDWNFVGCLLTCPPGAEWRSNMVYMP